MGTFNFLPHVFTEQGVGASLSWLPVCVCLLASLVFSFLFFLFLGFSFLSIVRWRKHTATTYSLCCCLQGFAFTSSFSWRLSLIIRHNLSCLIFPLIVTEPAALSVVHMASPWICCASRRFRYTSTRSKLSQVPVSKENRTSGSLALLRGLANKSSLSPCCYGSCSSFSLSATSSARATTTTSF